MMRCPRCNRLLTYLEYRTLIWAKSTFMVINNKPEYDGWDYGDIEGPESYHCPYCKLKITEDHDEAFRILADTEY